MTIITITIIIIIQMMMKVPILETVGVGAVMIPASGSVLTLNRQLCFFRHLQIKGFFVLATVIVQRPSPRRM
jgi:hypothetical protein